jgi:hypothetical protein
MSLLDINENTFDHTNIIQSAIKKFLHEYVPPHANEIITIDNKFYLLGNKIKLEIEYDFNPEQWTLMIDHDHNVFMAKLKPNWAQGNKGISTLYGCYRGNFFGHISLDYILTNYGIISE